MRRFLFGVTFFAVLIFCSIPRVIFAAPADQGFQMQGQVDYNNADVNKQTAAFTGENGANFGRVKDVRVYVASIIGTFLVILGTLFLVYMIYGGSLILLSAGNEDKIEKGKMIFRNAIIGLAIILFSYAITWFVRWLFVASGDSSYEDCVPYSTDYNPDPLDESSSPLPNTHGC